MLGTKAQNELTQLLFGHFMKDFQFFFEGCNQSFINRIVVSLTYKSFDHNQLIQSSNAFCYDAYFICKGSVVVCEPTCYEEPILVYEKGTVFNTYQILLEDQLEVQYKAISTNSYSVSEESEGQAVINYRVDSKE